MRSSTHTVGGSTSAAAGAPKAVRQLMKCRPPRVSAHRTRLPLLLLDPFAADLQPIHQPLHQQQLLE